MMRTVIHDVVHIRPIISTFSNFTAYEWVATDKNGNKFEINFFSDHSSPLVIEPLHNANYKTKDEGHEDVEATL